MAKPGDRIAESPVRHCIIGVQISDKILYKLDIEVFPEKKSIIGKREYKKAEPEVGWMGQIDCHFRKTKIVYLLLQAEICQGLSGVYDSEAQTI